MEVTEGDLEIRSMGEKSRQKASCVLLAQVSPYQPRNLSCQMHNLGFIHSKAKKAAIDTWAHQRDSEAKMEEKSPVSGLFTKHNRMQKAHKIKTEGAMSSLGGILTD